MEDKRNMDIADTPEKIMEMAGGFQKSRILLSAVELGVFSLIEDKPAKSEDIATQCEADPRALDRLLSSLVSLGFLTKNNGLYNNTAHSSCFLVKSSPSYLASLHHTSHMWESWSTLTEAVQKGTSVIDKKKLTSEQTDAFIGAMHQFASKKAPELITLFEFKGNETFLDLGGGSGAFITEMGKTFPEANLSLFDLPEVTDIAFGNIKNAGLETQVNIIKGNMLNDNFGTGYDAVLISHIIHQFSREEIISLFKKVFHSLKPGGKILIHEFLVDKDRISPQWNVFFALNMLVNTQAGDTFTENEIAEFLKTTGFKNHILKDTEDRSSIIIGMK